MVETLHALYSRSNIGMEDFQPLVYLMYETEYLGVLHNLYEWSVVGPDYVDDPRYTISKKFSEVWTARDDNYSGAFV